MTTPVRDLFGIDTGSLAVFRIALGLAILADLLIRAPDLGALYTEEGVLPRSLLDEQVLNLVPHLMFDGALGQGLLFAVEGIVALLLAAGWRTRWVTIASWALLMSLQARNPAVRNGGDETFRLLLFWSMFLPLGASWSVDARRRTAQRRRASLPAALPAALLLQVALIYPFNALYKDGAAWTSDFTALELFLGNARWECRVERRPAAAPRPAEGDDGRGARTERSAGCWRSAPCGTARRAPSPPSCSPASTAASWSFRRSTSSQWSAS